MLSMVRDVENDKIHDVKTCLIEYCVRDFVGPVVLFELKRYGAGKLKVFPKDVHTEDASFSMSDLNVLKKACEEIYEEYGSFTLILPLFEVEINSMEDAKTAVKKKLLNIRLF